MMFHIIFSIFLNVALSVQLFSDSMATYNAANWPDVAGDVKFSHTNNCPSSPCTRLRGTNGAASITSSTLDFTNYDNIYLQIDILVKGQESTDFCKIQYSVNGGGIYTDLLQYGQSDNNDNNQDVGGNLINADNNNVQIRVLQQASNRNDRCFIANIIVTGDLNAVPSKSPTKSPSKSPSNNPSKSPSNNPSVSPSNNPSNVPTKAPSSNPSKTPTNNPSMIPSSNPSMTPSLFPSINPSKSPSNDPSTSPSNNPTLIPTNNPSASTNNPSISPTKTPSKSPSNNPTISPIIEPTKSPSNNPSNNPSISPSNNPSISPSINPSISPSKSPSNNPSISPSINPSISPSNNPSSSPIPPPTLIPSKYPSNNPTTTPSKAPSKSPSINPTQYPSNNPSIFPSNNPSISPSKPPTSSPNSYSCTNPSISWQTETQTYSATHGLQMNIYYPLNWSSGTKYGCIIFVHGGLWQSGGRTASSSTTYCKNVVTNSNILCATIDYRKTNTISNSCTSTDKDCHLGPGICNGNCNGMWPSFTEDAAQAITYLSTYNKCRSDALFCSGHSAGGQICADLAIDKNIHLNGIDLSGSIGIEGIYNLTKFYDGPLGDGYEYTIEKAFGSQQEADWCQVGDITCNININGYTQNIPLLFVHSPDDPWVLDQQAREVTCRANGITVAQCMCTSYYSCSCCDTYLNGPKAEYFNAVSGSHSGVLTTSALANKVKDFVCNNV